MSPRRGFQPAVRRGKKARIAIDGVAGSGKTWTALLTARELTGPDGRVGIIDTERGSAALYADEFAFDELPWEPPYDPRELAETIAAEGANFDVLIVDSLSHFWRGEGGVLDIVDASGRRDAGGNRFGGWKSGTPAQNAMVDALLLAKCHIIVTMRSAQEWVIVENERGHKVPKRVGMAPVQRNDLEYEFTVMADLDLDHTITVSKSRCRALADRHFPAGHGQKFGQILRDWLESADSDVEPPVRAVVTDAAPMADRPAKAAHSDGDLSSRVSVALHDLVGAERGKVCGKHRISWSGGMPVLTGRSDDDLRTIAAELGVLSEEVPAEPAARESEDALPLPMEPSVAQSVANGVTHQVPPTGSTSDLVRLAAEAMDHIAALSAHTTQAELDTTLRRFGYPGEPRSRSSWVRGITRADTLADLNADLRTARSLANPSDTAGGVGLGDSDDIPF